MANKNVQALDEILGAAREQFSERLPKSRQQHENAATVLPGGNTRSVLYTEPFPICMKRGVGNRLFDIDENEYLDLAGELTAGLYGHSHSVIREAITSTLENVGLSLGASNLLETQLAKLIIERFPSVERIRFCNSGTEANLYALSVARYFTRKRKVLVFEGGYHGGVLSFAHGVATNTVDPQDWIVGRYNDAQGVKALIENTPDLAAVLVEAMQGAGGCIPGELQFLQTIQTCAKEKGVVFILDEVMTSRLSPGGLQSSLSLSPDLTTMGKYIGGGLPFGAFGGKEELMSTYDPRIGSNPSHSGTFNNNTLTLAAGYAGLAHVYTPDVNVKLNAMGDGFRERLNHAMRGTKMVVTGIGAVMTIHFIPSGEAAKKTGIQLEEESIIELRDLFWFWCVEKGFWFVRRGMVALTLGTTEEELDSFVGTVESFIKHYDKLVLV
ncbi:putative glutamate-1-semialdehyde 2,1-aminomutase [Xylona heveae TC161]|uniref:Putative glutamate-1-semialdehyde 2,1-aminomutase n=1 Tax=Xylona heveae (strain CBS 132557 / TC161) TaxID=1328760 RepID=A0A165A8R2_XYLHT|nr:putative glutamate-1-semialdehyde 2,1-aminomutase [Xylona heveae TC161]KZF20102.1 putative glutamate-1-semialdehyde 2,1-aminomutase [Xylona heveae TC161]